VIAIPRDLEFARVLWTRLREQPSSSAISRIDRPCACNRAILTASTTKRGLPSFVPLARAFRRPARTRSVSRERVHLARAAERLVRPCRLHNPLHNRTQTCPNIAKKASQSVFNPLIRGGRLPGLRIPEPAYRHQQPLGILLQVALQIQLPIPPERAREVPMQTD